MPIGSVIKILRAYKRYVDHMNDHGFDDVIENINQQHDSLLITMRGHMGETYDMEVSVSESTRELVVKNAISHEDVFEVIDKEEYGLTEAKLHYIKFGSSQPLPQ